MSSPSKSFYQLDYRNHLSATQDHLLGSQNPDPPLKCSYISPTGYWTPAEKNIFFHALVVHSRLRPDLIASCLPNKTFVDVCTYIDHLEAASYDNPPDDHLRSDLPRAMEVSDDWIAYEEVEASTL